MDHLPLFRQAKIFARSGVDLSMSTLADWVGACGVALAPLAQARLYLGVCQWGACAAAGGGI
jgi:transposase